MRPTANLKTAALTIIGLALSACGAANTAGSSSPASSVSGVVTSDAKAAGVTLRDSSSPAQARTTVPDQGGAFSVDVTDLTPPFVLRAEDATGRSALYAVALHAGDADINELTDAAVAAAAGGEDSGEAWTGAGEQEASRRLDEVIASLRTVLKPLFDLYQVTRIGGDDDGAPDGMRAMLRDVSFTVSAGMVTVTNRKTGGVIYSAPLSDLTSGVFHPENMPDGPAGTPTCNYTYSAWGDCQPDGTQSRTVAAATPDGCTGTPVLTQPCSQNPPPPGTCTSFTYSAWSPAACDATGVQSRTVASSAPAGCTGGSPVLTQTCTPPTLDGAALYGQSCSRCHGALASSNLKGRGMSVTMIKNGGMSQGLTDAQLQAVVTAVGP